HQSPLALAGRYLGQVGDLKANVSKDLISDLVHSEVCHAVYQALSRGSCRVMDNGKAKPMRAWVIDKDKEIERTLKTVMKGVNWQAWETGHVDHKVTIAQTTALRIVGYLEQLPEEVTKISTKKLKIDAGLTEVPETTFSRALKNAVTGLPGWDLGGRS